MSNDRQNQGSSNDSQSQDSQGANPLTEPLEAIETMAGEVTDGVSNMLSELFFGNRK